MTTCIIWIASTAVHAVIIAASLRWLALGQRSRHEWVKRRDRVH